ncbi:MAG TPA: NrfD/PsrC family molybdoenzyme membrane anchor subunit [Gaiellaceae bacterium]|nr:NrfD/PsrC family molybdoenzyme membrane anchor subunit [Gaiellaceae bacterium]
MTDEFGSYYGRPILKEPVWKWMIPAYLYAGGLGGASGTLSAVALATGHERLGKVSSYVGAAADAVSPLLLVADLGRPERFLNMFRVFKVTSPMSVGSWLLAAGATASGVGAALELLGRLRPLRIAAHAAAAVLGPAQSTYTAALVADTAIPVWHEARRELPFVFAASSAATAGAAAAALVPPAEAGPARRLAVWGSVARVAGSAVMQARLGLSGEVYRRGAAGALSVAANACTAAGAALLGRRGRESRAAAALGGALVLGGELASRWAIFRAGFQSARDPKYTVVPQRERLTRSDVSSRPVG